MSAKNGFLPLKGKVILLLFHFISTMTSFTSTLLFAPSLGLFNLMWHWRLGTVKGSIENMVYDIKRDPGNDTFYPVFFKELWQPIKQGQMMPLSFIYCVAAFMTLAALHMLRIHQIKSKSSKGFASAKWTCQIHNILLNMVTVLPFKDWDEIRATDKE